MIPTQIRIEVDRGLPSASGRISLQAHNLVRRLSKTGFFPADSQAIPGDPTDYRGIGFAIDPELQNDVFQVSPDVKENYYPSRNSIGLQ